MLRILGGIEFNIKLRGGARTHEYPGYNVLEKLDQESLAIL